MNSQYIIICWTCQYHIHKTIVQNVNIWRPLSLYISVYDRWWPDPIRDVQLSIKGPDQCFDSDRHLHRITTCTSLFPYLLLSFKILLPWVVIPVALASLPVHTDVTLVGHLLKQRSATHSDREALTHPATKTNGLTWLGLY